MELLALILFISLFILILYGFPVAFTLGGLSVIYAFCFLDPQSFAALPSRIMGVMSNYVLLAVPLFVFMGIMLEKSGLAESMLETMASLFGRIRGGLAISVIVVGALLAASTGIVGATVVTMGLISLPTMLKRGYSPELATGTIASSGTLGQIIPPSIVLVLLASVLNVPVGDLFKAAVVPGLLLVVAYIAYVSVKAIIHPHSAPTVKMEIPSGRALILAFALPLLLIVSVLGSIFWGIATPTEAAAIGALGATLLTILQKKFTKDALRVVMRETTHLTSMVFIILLGATTFSLVFRELRGDVYLTNLVLESNLSPHGFLLLVMTLVFVSGFFIDFIEIIFIIVPVVAPIFHQMGVDLLWIGILMAVNLQTSFLTPPFGFSLFYLKGVAPAGVTTGHLYRGIVPFVLIQLVFLLLIAVFPQIATFLLHR